MKQVIYVHGANGSGKTSLANALIMYAGGELMAAKHEQTEAVVTYAVNGRLAFIGPYHRPTGGADSVQPYAAVPATIAALAATGHNVFCEGLMTPGIETCTKLSLRMKQLKAVTTFVWLHVPLDVCIKHVLERRARKGNTSEFDPHNVERKWRSSQRWADNLELADLNVLRLSWRNARDFASESFGIDASGAVGILD